MSLEGAGGVRFWGFSPATDLTPEAPKAEADEKDAPLRALLIAASDVRHLLATVAAAAKTAHEGGAARAMEFAVFEREPEVLARHLLLLAIALDFELPRRERAELLLEVWANALLREKTATYVGVKAAELGRAIAHDEGPLAPLIDTDSLKSRDRDALEQVLRTWGEAIEFDVVKLRDERLRSYYGARYDARKNVLEWDYTMELLEIASIVHKIHWREWRMTGIAFEVRDSTYSTPNRTLASMAYGRQAGRSVMKRGFWCDIANGPWVACGVECDDERLTNKRNDMHHKSSCDIAYYNTLSYLSQIETGQPFSLKQEDIPDFEYGGSVATGGLSKGFLNAGKAKGNLNAVVEEVAEVDGATEEATAEAEAEAAADAKRAAETRARVVAAKMARLPKFTIKVLGGDWLDVQRKPRHQRAFDVAVIGTHMAFVMGSDRLNGLLKPKANVLLETAKFLVEIRKQNRQEYAGKLVGVASRLGWSRQDASREPDGEKDAFIRFAYDETTAKSLAEEAHAKLKAAAGSAAADASVPELTSKGAAEGGEASVDVTDGSADASSIACLKIADGAEEATEGATAEGAEAAPPAPPVKLSEGSAAAVTVGGGKVCAITGRPAKYRDPISGLPYADLAAFKELRKQYPDPKAAEKEAAAAAAATPAEGAAETEGAEGASGDGEAKPSAPVPSERPIQIGGGFARRMNKVA